MLLFTWDKQKDMHVSAGEKPAEDKEKRKKEELQGIIKEIFRSRKKITYTELVTELMQAMETIDRVDVAEAVVHHLKARKETRWAGWQTRSDYPERDDAHFDCFIESRRDRRRAKCPRLPAV